MFGRIHLWNFLVLYFHFWEFFITYLSWLLENHLFIVSASSWFSLEKVYISSNLPISSRLSILLIIPLLILISYDPLCFSGITCNWSSFISHLIYLSSLFLNLVKGLSILLLSFMDHFYCVCLFVCFWSLFYLFLLWFLIFLSSTNSRLCFSLSGSTSCMFFLAS